MVTLTFTLFVSTATTETTTDECGVSDWSDLLSELAPTGRGKPYTHKGRAVRSSRKRTKRVVTNYANAAQSKRHTTYDVGQGGADTHRVGRCVAGAYSRARDPPPHPGLATGKASNKSRQGHFRIHVLYMHPISSFVAPKIKIFRSKFEKWIGSSPNNCTSAHVFTSLILTISAFLKRFSPLLECIDKPKLSIPLPSSPK